MEQSLSSLAYKGSIPEAISEAKKQRKLFVVYISGQDSDSSHLENSTWTDLNVAVSVSKYCILLHIPEESTDAANFSAIYPQKSAPCITAIGFNGVQLWQNEGFVSAEVLASSLEKVWLSLQIQETTATVMSAALASKKSEPSISGIPTTASTDGSSSSTAVLSDQGSSSSTVVPLSLTDKNGQSQDAVEGAPNMMNESKGPDCKFEDKTKDLRDKTSLKPVDGDELKCVGEKQSSSSSSTEAGQGSKDVAIKESTSGGDHISSITEGGSPRGITVNQSVLVGGSQASIVGENETLKIGNSEAEDDKRVDGTSDAHYLRELTVNQSGILGGGSQAFSIEENEAVQVVKGEAEDLKKVDAVENARRVNRSSDAYLNIRLPDGTSLQEMFSLTSTLRIVKGYIDENQGSGIGSYDLAIPYPRKVFTEQDLSKPLSELGLYDRQALIVVPHQQGTGYLRGRSSLTDQTVSRNIVDTPNGSNGSYFSFVKRVLSFINPFSYLGGGASSSSSEEQSQNGMWQYSPNPTVRNNLTQSTSESGRTEGSRRRPPASPFGSNIHTLKHDEDDERFSDRNKFWNGNSTQYGGDDDSK
ncbi:plant UBX domain-containing protein 11 isoform X1 [Rosa rugosa]|uniref:plant UBX domain-containing protein 11 isoform X1 n=1 Tax=Rosa rugosa TaxID=74645 RepID=UPI002B4073B5|nr:plant UBX domain-containing protein 11 isoform X1 [Rosa rugosa]XP_061991402.1 plant UBX domain-containing protein 11 isoform X1 [Rosa rugosa]